MPQAECSLTLNMVTNHTKTIQPGKNPKGAKTFLPLRLVSGLGSVEFNAKAPSRKGAKNFTRISPIHTD